MTRNIALGLLPVLILAACGTPQERCISRNTSAACFCDSAPLTIWLFCFASGPTIWARQRAAIRADLPFFRPMDRYARFVPTGLS